MVYNSQFSIPNSQFPIPNSQFPIPNSQLINILGLQKYDKSSESTIGLKLYFNFPRLKHLHLIWRHQRLSTRIISIVFYF